MGSRRRREQVTVLDAVTSTGVSTVVRVSDYQHITFSHATAASSDQVVKLQGAFGSTVPDFSSTRAVDNEWDYINSIDLQTGTAIDGDTGMTATTADVRQFSANVDALDWVSFEITTGTAGALTTKVSPFSNS